MLLYKDLYHTLILIYFRHGTELRCKEEVRTLTEKEARIELD